MKSKQYQRVKDLLHKYTIIQPTNAQVFCLMGEALEQTNDIDHAKSWLVKETKAKKRNFVFSVPSFIFNLMNYENLGIYKL